MSTSTFAGRLVALPGGKRLRCTDRGLLALLLLGCAVAGWPSIRSLFDLSQGDTPLSYVPFVFVAGTLFLLRCMDGASVRRRSRDGFVDGVAAVVAVAAAGVLLLLLPVTMSWYYWLDRLDIVGLVMLLCALILIVWGLPGLAQLRLALPYLLMAWPLPILLLDNQLIPRLSTATVAAARTVVPLLPLGLRPDAVNASGLLVTFHGQTSSLVITQACAGANSAAGVVVMGLPIALLARGSWERRGLWLLTGAVLSWLVNLLRIVVIGASASIWGPAPTMRLLHPVVGLIFFVLAFGLLLEAARYFQLDIWSAWFRRSSPRPTSSTEPAHVQCGWKKVCLLGALLVGAAVAESNLAQFGWISESRLPRVSLAGSSHLLFLPPGWTVTDSQAIAGWQPFFGRTSVAAVLTVAAPSKQPVDVQAVLSRDLASFSAYQVENCYTFHGYTLKSVHRLALGNGVTGTLIDFQQRQQPVAALYWLQPVQTAQGLYHERIVLVASPVAAARRQAALVQRGVPSTSAAPGVVQPVQDAAASLVEFFSPWVGGSAGPRYSRVNGELRSLGEAMIIEERHHAAS